MANHRNVVLILDEASVQSATGVSFHLNPAVKHPENPVLIPGMPHEPDGLQVNWPSCVIYDPEDKLFRCWYHGRDAIQYDGQTHPQRKPFANWLGRIWETCYAESEDGVHWIKPPLGQYEHHGRDTNVIMSDYRRSGTGVGFDHGSDLACVWRNPVPESRTEKFLALFTEIGADAHGQRTFKIFRKVLYASPDGRQWTRRKVAYDASSSDDDLPAPRLVDVNTVIYDADEADPQKRIKAYGQSDRPTRPGRGNRGVALLTAPDYFSMRCEDQIVLLEGQEPYEDEIHWSSATKLQNGYFMIVHDSSRFDWQHGLEPPRSDLRLALSPDGLNFRRIHPDTPLVLRGRKAEFDANQLVAGSCVEFRDEVFIYYHGAPCIYRPWPRTPHGEWEGKETAPIPSQFRASNVYPTFMGLAVLPRDRFAYAEGPGSVTTHPLTLKGEDLWINADGDAMEVALLDLAGRQVNRGCVTHERRRTIYRRLLWTGPTPEGQYRLKIDLRKGERLYSIQCGE